MPTIEITKGAIQYFMYMTGVDNREEAEEFLQVAIGMCNIRDSVPSQSAADGVGELINAVEHLLQFKLELVAYDQRDALLLHSVEAARAALKKIRQGSGSNPPDVGN